MFWDFTQNRLHIDAWERSQQEVTYLRGALGVAHARIAELTDRLAPPLPPPEVVASAQVVADDLDAMPSVEVVVEEFAEQAADPNALRRQLMRFAALERTKGRSEPEIVDLIRRGAESPSVADSEEFV